jgi:hypothetical protein
MEKYMGLFVRWWGFSSLGIILQKEMMVDTVHGSWTTGGTGPRWTTAMAG